MASRIRTWNCAGSQKPQHRSTQLPRGGLCTGGSFTELLEQPSFQKQGSCLTQQPPEIGKL
eukprot:6203813-Alexandrium_andersonii.AAC.1